MVKFQPYKTRNSKYFFQIVVAGGFSFSSSKIYNFNGGTWIDGPDIGVDIAYAASGRFGGESMAIFGGYSTTRGDLDTIYT